jgi:hypothetical protein
MDKNEETELSVDTKRENGRLTYKKGPYSAKPSITSEARHPP